MCYVALYNTMFKIHRVCRLVWLLLVMFGLTVCTRAQTWEPRNATDTLHAYYACYANMLLLPQSGWRLALRFGGPDITPAATTITPSYYIAVTTVDTIAFAAVGDSERRELVIHELWHVALREMADVAWTADTTRGRVTEEQMVTRISRWQFWQRMCLWRPDRPD